MTKHASEVRMLTSDTVTVDTFTDHVDRIDSEVLRAANKGLYTVTVMLQGADGTALVIYYREFGYDAVWGHVKNKTIYITLSWEPEDSVRKQVSRLIQALKGA